MMPHDPVNGSVFRDNGERYKLVGRLFMAFNCPNTFLIHRFPVQRSQFLLRFGYDYPQESV